MSREKVISWSGLCADASVGGRKITNPSTADEIIPHASVLRLVVAFMAIYTPEFLIYLVICQEACYTLRIRPKTT